MADIWCIGGNVNDFPRLQRLAAWSGIVLTVATSSTLLRSFWRRKTTPGRCSRTHTAPADRIERRQLVPLEHGFRSGGLPIPLPPLRSLGTAGSEHSAPTSCFCT